MEYKSNNPEDNINPWQHKKTCLTSIAKTPAKPSLLRGQQKSFQKDCRRNKKPHKMTNKKQAADFEPLRQLVRHHIESFDYMVEEGLNEMFDRIKPVIIHDSFTNKKLKISVGNPEIFPPQKEHGSKRMRDVLLPFECRQAKISYTGKLMADVEFQYDDSAVIREKFNFGQFPIMLKSKRCHLQDADPQKLKSFKEEASEVGGYFILNGLERVFRAVILPKQNYPMSMVRNSFRDRREGYTDKAVIMRARVYVRKKKGGGKIRRKTQAAGEGTGKEIRLAEGCEINTNGSSGGNSSEQLSEEPAGSNSEAEKAADKQQKLGDMLEKRGIMKIWEAELACKDWEKSWEELRNRNLEKEREVGREL